MIRVAIDCHKLEDADGAHRAGVGRHTYKLLEELSRIEGLERTHRFHLYFKASVPADIPFLDRELFVCRVAKLPFFLPFLRPSFNTFFHLALPLWALRDRIAVGFFPSFMLPALWPTRSVVVLTNDIYYEMSQGSLPLRYRIGYQLFARWAALRATAVTTQTAASRREICKYFRLREEDVEVVGLGADVEHLRPTTSVQKENFIFYLGQAFPRRHLRETMLAFEQIAPQHSQLRMVAVGVDKYNPPCLDALAQEINQRLGGERIRRMEGVEEATLKQLYQHARLFTYISSSEAMGLPPLEALAAGTVPVVADTPTTREIFAEHALFVDNPDDPSAIAAVLERGITEEQESSRILSGREEVLHRYSWSTHAQSMLRLFNEALRK